MSPTAGVHHSSDAGFHGNGLPGQETERSSKGVVLQVGFGGPGDGRHGHSDPGPCLAALGCGRLQPASPPVPGAALPGLQLDGAKLAASLPAFANKDILLDKLPVKSRCHSNSHRGRLKVTAEFLHHERFHERWSRHRTIS